MLVLRPELAMLVLLKRLDVVIVGGPWPLPSMTAAWFYSEGGAVNMVMLGVWAAWWQLFGYLLL